MNLGATINSRATDADPALAAEGKSLWFASNRSGGQGELDIWFASAGRSGLRSPPAGVWKLLLLSGAQRVATLASAGDGAFELQTGGVFDGVYLWRDGLLAVERPKDPRYVGLAWEWQGDKLVLISEPPDHPSGAAYVGATLEFVSPEISADVRSSIPTLPARIRQTGSAG